MLGSRLRRAAGGHAIDGDDRDGGGIEELIEGRVAVLLQRSHKSLGVHRRCREQLVAGG